MDEPVTMRQSTPANDSKEAAAWKLCLKAAGIEGATLLAQSRYDPFRRTYLQGGKVYKLVIRNRQVTSTIRANDLAGEHAILQHCAGIPGTPNPLEYNRTDLYELLVLERIHGVPLSQTITPWRDFSVFLVKLTGIILRLCWRGVSHNDIKPENILVSTSHAVSMVDFDQATHAHVLVALIQSLFGIRVQKAQVRGSLAFVLVKRLIGKRLPPSVVRGLRWLLRDKDNYVEWRLPTLPEDASPRARALLTAWKFAQRSDASSPGRNVAYYSLDFEGIRFPGERSWDQRWPVLRDITDYSGKRVLELGCNMALLSSWLLCKANARAALAIDADERILEAARIVASVFDVAPVFQRVNFDDPDDWKTALVDFDADVVFALNILNWVCAKQRLLNFLGRFPELIFEGHEDLRSEVSRLRAVGFKSITIAAMTERGRYILHCRRDPPLPA